MKKYIVTYRLHSFNSWITYNETKNHDELSDFMVKIIIGKNGIITDLSEVD